MILGISCTCWTPWWTLTSSTRRSRIRIIFCHFNLVNDGESIENYLITPETRFTQWFTLISRTRGSPSIGWNDFLSCSTSIQPSFFYGKSIEDYFKYLWNMFNTMVNCHQSFYKLLNGLLFVEVYHVVVYHGVHHVTKVL